MARPGTISPAAKTWIWNLLSVASATAVAITSAEPYSVSSDFGQLQGMRHLMVGIDCAIAGAATAALAAVARPAVFRNSRRFIQTPPLGLLKWADADALHRSCPWPVGAEPSRVWRGACGTPYRDSSLHWID